MEEVDKFLPAHSEFLDKYYAQKKIIFSGILCSSVPSRDELTPLIYSLLCSLSSDA